jgi:hypothetical protein
MDGIPFDPAWSLPPSSAGDYTSPQDSLLNLCLGAELVIVIFKRSVWCNDVKRYYSKFDVGVVVKFDDMLNATADLR